MKNKKKSTKIDDALRQIEDSKTPDGHVVLKGVVADLVVSLEPLLAALHLTVAYKALEEHISDDRVPMLDDVSEEIVVYLKKALGLA